jgi:hypothetical protein
MGPEWSPAITGDDRLIFLTSTPQRLRLPTLLPDILSANSDAMRLLAREALSSDFPASALVTPRRVSFKVVDANREPAGLESGRVP